MKHRRHDREEDVPPDAVTREEVIAHMATLPRATSIREIAHGMGLKHTGRRFLPRVLQQLKRGAEIEEIHGGRYRLAGAKHSQAQTSQARPRSNEKTSRGPLARPSADPNLVSGRLVAHR